jgi:hypothetical protein
LRAKPRSVYRKPDTTGKDERLNSDKADLARKINKETRKQKRKTKKPPRQNKKKDRENKILTIRTLSRIRERKRKKHKFCKVCQNCK